MKIRMVWLGSLLTAAILLIGAAQSQKSEGLIVHEWGTFLAMNGSDGVSLDGMYHEEHALPAFVHARSRDQLHIPGAGIKGETPVIYFYTNRIEHVDVRVRFPQGIWTQWYPNAQFLGPSLAGTHTPLHLSDGHITWQATIVPNTGGPERVSIPQSPPDSLWNFARETDSAYVQTGENGHRMESEKFLFYRGLGQAPLPLQSSTSDGGTLSVSSGEPYIMRHLFVLRVENGRGVWKYLPSVAPGEKVTQAIPTMAEAKPLAEFTRAVGDELAAKLTESGLYPKEARAMVNTWSRSYFGSDGIRVLFVLPQAWTDAFIPLEINPKPAETVRVMVGRLELLTPEREQQAEKAVAGLATTDTATRDQAFDFLRSQGRYVEPILRRTLRSTHDARVQTLCKRLLTTDFVTELRAGSRATDGAAPANDPDRDRPVFVRARLASLLREVGLDGEAMQEAKAAEAALREMKMPPTDRFEARPFLRAYARIAEGEGDDKQAVTRYSDFIQFGSQRKTKCEGCHPTEGPRTMAWFRDWWAGKKYAQYVARLGQTERAIAANQGDLDRNANVTASQMRLAYLYASKGDKERAAALWARVEEGDKSAKSE